MFHMEELKEYIITGTEIVDETFMYSKGVNLNVLSSQAAPRRCI